MVGYTLSFTNNLLVLGQIPPRNQIFGCKVKAKKHIMQGKSVPPRFTFAKMEQGGTDFRAKQIKKEVLGGRNYFLLGKLEKLREGIGAMGVWKLSLALLAGRMLWLNYKNEDARAHPRLVIRV